MTQLALPNTGVNSVYYYAFSLATTNVPPGTYAVYGKISDGTHSRYLNAPQLVQIVTQPPPVLGFTQAAGQPVISISGGAGHKIILQSSADLRTWQPIYTNNDSSGLWFYPYTAVPGPSQLFYRAVAE